MPCGFGTVFGIQREPVAKVRPLFVGCRLRACFRTIPPRAGKVEPAIPAGTEVFPAYDASQRTAKRLLFCNSRTTVPAHDCILAMFPPAGKGLGISNDIFTISHAMNLDHLYEIW